MHVASVSLLFLLLASVFDCCHTSSQNAWASVARCYTPHLLALLMPCFCLVANIHALVCQHVPRAMLFSQSAVTCCMSLVLSSPSTAMFYIFKGRSFFFFLGTSCLQRQRKAAMQACKISARAPPPRRSAGKGVYDRAARVHASKKDGRGARSAEVRKQHTKNPRRECNTSDMFISNQVSFMQYM